jgi:indole-3-glycerol phosphate synthase
MNTRRLSDVIRQARWHSRAAVIADIKMHSPRDGSLLDYKALHQYLSALLAGGVDAISIVTDARWFGGNLDVARLIRKSTHLPLMRKDYFRSVEQMDESSAVGFTAVHLTLQTIGDLDLVAALKHRAEQLGLETILGIHTTTELDQALTLGASIIGINNRKICELETDEGTVNHTEILAPLVPRGVLLISESSLMSTKDVARAWAAGANAVLVGTALAKSPDPEATVRSFLHAHLSQAIYEHI